MRFHSFLFTNYNLFFVEKKITTNKQRRISKYRRVPEFTSSEDGEEEDDEEEEDDDEEDNLSQAEHQLAERLRREWEDLQEQRKQRLDALAKVTVQEHAAVSPQKRARRSVVSKSSQKKEISEVIRPTVDIQRK